MASQTETIPSDPSEWRAAFIGMFGNESLNLYNINDRQKGGKKVSGSTFIFRDFLWLRAYIRNEFHRNLVEALIEADFFNRECWKDVESKIFWRPNPDDEGKPLAKEDTSPAAQQKTTEDAPCTPQRAQTSQPMPGAPRARTTVNKTMLWYSPELPMGTFFNLQKFVPRSKIPINLSCTRRELAKYTGTFRTVLSSISDIDCHSRKNKETYDGEEDLSPKDEESAAVTLDNQADLPASPLAHKSGIAGSTALSPPPISSALSPAPDPDPDPDPDSDSERRSLDETINTNFFVLVINTAITRSHDFNVRSWDDSRKLDLLNPTEVSCIAHRMSFTIGKTRPVYTAIVDGYTRLPEAFHSKNITTASAKLLATNPHHVGFLFEIKRKTTSRHVQYQIAAELAAFIYVRYELLNNMFEKNPNNAQHELLISFTGNQVKFYLASFKQPYLRFLTSVDSVIVPENSYFEDGLLKISVYGPFRIATNSNELEEFLKIIVALDLMARRREAANRRKLGD